MKHALYFAVSVLIFPALAHWQVKNRTFYGTGVVEGRK